MWQLSVPQTNDTSVRPKLKLEAFHSGANEVFYVNYSTDQINWRNVLTVSKSDAQTLEANLPAGLSGDVWIKIKDSSNDTSIDSVFIDYLSIETAGGSTRASSNSDSNSDPVS